MIRLLLFEPTRLIPRSRTFAAAFGLLAAFAALDPAHAGEIDLADGIEARWDNTVRYTASFRVTPRDAQLLANINGDDGDRNFAPGLVSNRLDLVSVLDVTKGEFGVHVSAAAWYDTVYHAGTDNDSPSTYNPRSVPNTSFAKAVRNLHGQYVDLEDAFVFGNFSLDGVPLSVRAGRQTLLWGESLFFNPNSIAAAQTPYDYNKDVSAPSDYSRDVFLPVAQLSLTAQPTPDLSLSFYYQFERRVSRLPGTGSYFSTADFLGVGGERLFTAPGIYLRRAQDDDPSADGQFGVSLHVAADDTDFGLYAVRFNSSYPTLRVEPGPLRPSGYAGQYALAYAGGLELYGVSFSTAIDDSNIAGEVSLRRGAPLLSVSPVAWYALHPNDPDHGYAYGDTLNGQLSTITTLSRGAAWDSAELQVELAANDVLSVTRDAGAINPSRDRFAMNLRALFVPRYFEVAPNLDLSVPIGIGYNLVGRSSTDYRGSAGTGDAEIGLAATYRSLWSANLTLTTYLGSPAYQPLADRDFVSISIERTF